MFKYRCPQNFLGLALKPFSLTPITLSVKKSHSAAAKQKFQNKQDYYLISGAIKKRITNG